jgi:hypothetical protein
MEPEKVVLATKRLGKHVLAAMHATIGCGVSYAVLAELNLSVQFFSELLVELVEPTVVRSKFMADRGQ